MQLKNWDKAIEYYEKAAHEISIAPDQPENARSIIYLYENLGQAYNSKKDFDVAIEYWEKCHELLMKEGNKSENNP